MERMFEAFGFTVITLVNASEYVACGTGYSTAVNRDMNLVSTVPTPFVTCSKGVWPLRDPGIAPVRDDYNNRRPSLHCPLVYSKM
jgi:hypothetical protein